MKHQKRVYHVPRESVRMRVCGGLMNAKTDAKTHEQNLQLITWQCIQILIHLFNDFITNSTQTTSERHQHTHTNANVMIVKKY